MNGKECNKINLKIGSMGFLIFLIWSIYIWFCEVIDLACYYLGWTQASVFSRIVVLVVCICMLYFLSKKVTFCMRRNRSKLVYIVGIGVIAYGFLKAIIPDFSYDVTTYHFLSQEPGFVNNFYDNIAPGNFQQWGFRLPDRMIYIFRAILGYRAGSVVNSIVMILVWFQVMDLLEDIAGEKLKNITSRIKTKALNGIVRVLLSKEVLSFGITFIYDIVMQSGTYMVEIILVPLSLEMVRLVLEDAIEIKARSIYFSVIVGLLFAMKMTNIVYIIPCLVIFLIKVVKKLNISTIIICVACGVLPVCVYLIYNLTTTGNPVFPYYNTIFQSPYFSNTNFKDMRWGGDTLFEKVFWIFYVVFKPEYRQNEIFNKASICYAGILIASIWYGFNIIKGKIKEKENILFVIFVAAYGIWSITTGHTRYFIVGFLLLGILSVNFLLNVQYVLMKSRIKAIAIIPVGIILLEICQPVYAFQSVAQGKEYAWRESTNIENIKENAKYLFKDHSFLTEEQQNKVDAFVFNTSVLGSFACTLDEDATMVYQGYMSNISDENVRNKLQNQIDTLFEKNMNVYDIWFDEVEENFVENLNNNGYIIEEMEHINHALSKRSNISLVKISKNTEKKNELHCQGDSWETEVNTADDFLELHGIIGLNKNLGWYDNQTLTCNIYLTDEEQKYCILSMVIEEGQWYNLDEVINVEEIELSSNKKIYYECLDESGNAIAEPYQLYCINLELSTR